MSIKSKWRRHVARKDKQVAYDAVTKEASRATRQRFTPEADRYASQIRSVKRSSYFGRVSDAVYGKPVDYMAGDIRMIGLAINRLTVSKKVISTSGIPNSQVSKTDQTEYFQRQKIRRVKVDHKLNNPIQISEKSINALLVQAKYL